MVKIEHLKVATGNVARLPQRWQRRMGHDQARPLAWRVADNIRTDRAIVGKSDVLSKKVSHND
jgi:hypothetical protein